MNKMAS